MIAGVLAKYRYLWNGEKISAVDSQGNGYLYMGSVRYNLSGNGPVFESMPFSIGRIVREGNGYTVHYFLTDHLGSVRTIADQAGTIIAEYDYLPYGKQHKNSSLATSDDNDFRYNGKELQERFGVDLYDSQARMQRFDGRFNSPDPLAGDFPSTSPYAYCAGNPINRIDPDGMRDTTFVIGRDKPITPQPGTATPIQNSDGTINENAYNCHSFAWTQTLGDPTDPSNANLTAIGVTRWDNNPDNNMTEYSQLNSNAPNIPGDRVIYYVNSNGNGKYDQGENISHSAVVKTVNDDGYTTSVIGKMGQAEISINHPAAPGYYSQEGGVPTSRAYYRNNNGAAKIPTSKTANVAPIKYAPKIIPSNATRVAPKPSILYR